MNTTIRTACLAALVALYGCGGGGGSDSGNTPPPVVDPTTSLTVSGVVTDAAVPNATVTVHVGSDSFTADAMTDADGAFTVDVEGDNDDALVTFEAVDGGTHLMSMPMTFGELAAQADDDGNVTVPSITNVTTAHYVLALSATSDGDFDSMDEVESVAPSVDSADLLELSAAIKLVVEARDGVVLPAEYDDTLELAQAIVDGSSSFVDDVETTSPGALDDAADDVLTDGNATVPFSASDAPGVYVDETNDTLIALFDGGLGWANAGGSIRQIGSWHVDAEGHLSMQYSGVEHEVHEVTLLGEAGDFTNVVTDVSTITDGDSDQTFETYEHTAFGTGFVADDVADGSFVLGDDEATALVFMVDGTGHNADAESGAQGASFSWQALSDGRLLLEYADAVVTVYRMSSSADDVLVVRTDAAGTGTDVSLTTLNAAD
jgi:hypothetical protein